MRFVNLFCWLFGGCTDQTINTLHINTLHYSQLPVVCRDYVHYFADAENLSREIAQTEQESSCNPFAESAFAKGLRQFTDSTGEWLSLTHCKHLGDYQPFNPEWSAHCGLVYMQLLQSNNHYGDYCFNRTVAELEYNGGSWVVKELNYVNNTSLSSAEKICGKQLLKNGRKRASWACRENYSYSTHISRRQLKYSMLPGRPCN